MNGENGGTRSFPRTDPEKPKNRFDLRKTISIAIFAVAIIIALLFCAAIIAQIASKISDSKTPTDNNGTSQTTKANIVFENIKISTSEVTKGALQLATSDHRAALSEEEIGNLTKLYSSAARKNNSVEYYTTAGTERSDYLTYETSENLGALAKALYEALDCNDITVKYAYFEPKTETASYDYPHALGTTVDICLKINGDSYPMSHKQNILDWINENCYRFGFVNSDPSGNVHDADMTVPTTQLRYVGIPHATYIMKNGISFEEYIERIKKHYTPSDPLVINVSDNKSYAVYFVAVNGVNSVKLPSNFEYTISGNNDGGIIVTVDLSKSK